MNPQPLVAPQPAMPASNPSPPSIGKRIFAALGSPFVPPLFITLILLVGNLSYGILESYWKTVLAIVTSIIAEMVLGRIFLRKWPHPASAYITGISVGILLRSPAFWPYALCSAISILSKYVLRLKGRHLWNPSNFGVSAMLFIALILAFFQRFRQSGTAMLLDPMRADNGRAHPLKLIPLMSDPLSPTVGTFGR